MDDIVYGDMEKYKTENYLFHYSKAETIFFKILFTNKLRFNKIQNMSDVFESKLFWYSSSYYVENMMSDLQNDAKSEIMAEQERKKLQIISFCDNYLMFNNQKYNLKERNHFKSYPGFLKFRMWDQYADKFNGCCLIINKEKLIYCFNEAFSNYSKLSDNVNYVYSPNDFRPNIDTSKPSDEEIKKYILDFYNIKNADYLQESEFRLSLINETSDDLLYLDLKDSIEGLILGPNISNSEHIYYLDFLNKIKINIDVYVFNILEKTQIPVQFKKIRCKK